MKHIMSVAFCFFALALSSCSDQSSEPYLKILGGGFEFNYRYATMKYGFVAKQLRPLPAGSILEASFDLPDSPNKFILTLPAESGKMQYVFESEALHGVKKDIPYKVRLRLLEASTAKELTLVEHEFRSTVDQDTLPTKAPVTGIGYQLAPEN